MAGSSSQESEQSFARRALDQWGEGPPSIEGNDEVARAKRRLLELAVPDTARPAGGVRVPGILQQRPFACAAAALGVGLIIGRVPMIRNILIKGATWGATTYAQRMMRQMTSNKNES